MNPDAFAVRWAEKERELGLSGISHGVIRFAGGALPRDAAPCLTFEDAGRQPRVWERFGVAADWPPEDRAALSTFRVLGFDGAGDPVCVEEPTGAVWVLDHEAGFRSRRFMNSGVEPLAECLLAYMGETDPGRFRQVVRAVDAPAMAEGTFWWYEAEGLADNGE
jgi:hypothetical protein